MGKVEGTVEGCIDGSGRRRRCRRYKGDRGHRSKVAFLGSELEGGRRWLLRSRWGELLSDTLLQLLLRILLSSSFASTGTSMVLPSPISALLLLLLELGGILVTLLRCAELVSSLLVRGDVDDSLSSAGFPSHVESSVDCL